MRTPTRGSSSSACWRRSAAPRAGTKGASTASRSPISAGVTRSADWHSKDPLIRTRRGPRQVGGDRFPNLGGSSMSEHTRASRGPVVAAVVAIAIAFAAFMWVHANTAGAASSGTQSNVPAQNYNTATQPAQTQPKHPRPKDDRGVQGGGQPAPQSTAPSPPSGDTSL